MNINSEHGPDLPGDELAQRALCAWNNVPFPNEFLKKSWDGCAEVTRDGWRRVAYELFSHALDESIKFDEAAKNSKPIDLAVLDQEIREKRTTSV